MKDRSDGLKLLRHQEIPVRHLLEKCIDQKGLLVWHAMGTGKSATGLSFIATIKHTKTFLITPSNLADVWKSEGQKFGIDLQSMIRRGKVEMHNYDRPESLHNDIMSTKVQDYVLVADEAQHLVSLLKQLDAHKAYKLIVHLRSFKKVFLLTGTPMYNDEDDFRLLVNIAAGKLVLPVNTDDFKTNFYKTSIWRSVFIGWFLTFFDKFLYQSRDFAGAALNLDMVMSGTESTSQQIYSSLIGVIQKVLYNFEISAIVAVSIPLLIPIIVLTLIKIALSSQIDKIRLLDTDKVARTVQSYVSYFEIPDSSRGNEYPRINVKREKINYNAKQIDLWLRFAMGHLTPQETVSLNITDTSGEADFFGDISTLDKYKFFGRVIGNLDLGEQVCPKFQAIEKIMKDKNGKYQQTVIYSNFEKQGAKLFAAFLKSKGIPYRYFAPQNSLSLKKKMLSDFGQSKFPVLIIHPSFIEGISIPGARQMHILEPVENQAVLEQIIARVARFGSHNMYPPSERSVNISIWCAVATSFYARLYKFGASQSLWARYQPWMGPWAKMSKFGYDITPDALITARGNLFADNLERLTKALTSHNILSLTINQGSPTCRIVPDPDNSFLKECSKLGG